MTTKQNTTKRTTKASGTKRAAQAKRTTNDTRSEVERLSADIIGKLAAGTVSEAEAIAEAKRIGDTITKRTTRDTIAMGALVGSVAIHAFGEPKAKAKLPGAGDVADAFLRTKVGRDSGYGRGTIVQYVNMARVPNRHEVLTLWEGFAASDEAVASDPKAYAMNTIGFLRFASAWKANRVDERGVIFASAEARKTGDTAKVRAVVSEAASKVASTKAKRTARAKAAKAKAEAEASDAMIGKVRVADVAALTKPQRTKLRELLDSLEA